MIAVYWQDLDETILVWTFRSIWTANEFRSALAIHLSLLDQVSHPVSLVLDLQKGIAPTNLIELATKGFRRPAFNISQIIVVGYVPTWKSLFSILTYVMGKLSVPVEFVETQAEANQFLFKDTAGV